MVRNIELYAADTSLCASSATEVGEKLWIVGLQEDRETWIDRKKRRASKSKLPPFATHVSCTRTIYADLHSLNPVRSAAFPPQDLFPN